MGNSLDFPFDDAIRALETITKKLRSELLLFGVATIIGAIIILAIGWFYGKNWYIPISVLLVYALTNSLIIFKTYDLKRIAELRRSTIKNGEILRNEIEKDFGESAKRAIDSLALSAKGLISKKQAGVLVLGWKNNLSARNIAGIWEGLPDILSISLETEYTEDGLAEKI